jgi:para-nitrobenzyl esterase
VQGSVEDGINVFKGIRYGADTEARRFRPALDPVRWTDTADATAYGNQCPQIDGGENHLFESWKNIQPSSEDCLFLNIWTPGLIDGKKRPVMVWFHGGGYVTGSGSSTVYDGVRLAKRGDVVLVTVNHRLNAFGYLYLGGVTKDPAFADSGNVGSLDMVMALRWVRANIARFGGDAGNVTIFGESGGAAKVSTMMALPAAAGLFHKVIAESGSMSLRGYDPAEANVFTSDLIATAGLKPNDIDGLAKLPMAQLVTAMAKSKSRGAFFRPVMDGRSMTRQPFDPDAPSLSRNVPLLVGTNRTEATLLLGIRDPSAFSLTWDDLPKRAGPFLRGGDAAAILAELRRLHPDETASDIYFRAYTLRQYRKTAITEAERKAEGGGAPVYMYRLDWQTPVDGGKWKTPHALELSFVFDNIAKSSSIAGSGSDQQHMADLMSDAWIAFARTGNPQTPALPAWPRYDANRRATMIFDLTPKVTDDPEGADRRLFAPLPVGRAD